MYKVHCGAGHIMHAPQVFAFDNINKNFIRKWFGINLDILYDTGLQVLNLNVPKFLRGQWSVVQVCSVYRIISLSTINNKLLRGHEKIQITTSVCLSGYRLFYAWLSYLAEYIRCKGM